MLCSVCVHIAHAILPCNHAQWDQVKDNLDQSIKINPRKKALGPTVSYHQIAIQAICLINIIREKNASSAIIKALYNGNTDSMNDLIIKIKNVRVTNQIQGKR